MSQTTLIARFKNSKADGFSLIEALVATGFIAIFSLAVIMVQAGHWNIVLGSQDRTSAVHLAEETIELAMALRFDELTQANFPEEAYGSIPNFPRFRRTTVIDATNPDFRNVTVIVFWPKADQADQPVMLTTTITQRPESST